jgi:selenide,water dikinase
MSYSVTKTRVLKERPVPSDSSEPRLTSLAHGRGCGCKLAPAVLQQFLADVPAARSFAYLLVGTETG